MSSTIIAKNIQVGTSGTATNNFNWYQPASPDGTVRLGVGNYGATTLDAVTVSNSGNVTVAGSLAGGALSGSSLAVSGAATTGSLTVNNNAISAVNSLGFRNRILNGDCRIDQRNAGASVTIPASLNVYTLDRWGGVGTQASKFSIQQNAGSVTPPAGFTNYLGVTSLSAYSVTSGDVFLVRQYIEGFNVADLGWGAAGAATVTLSFWVRSSLTGTFGGVVQNRDANRCYPFAYTISAANTWEQKSITIPGDTTGTWYKNNDTGIRLQFGLGAGSTYSGTAGAWTSSEVYTATGAVSVVGTNGATWYITGVQLEAGTVASPFQRVEYGEMLRACQRYYQRITAVNAGYNFVKFGNGFAKSSTDFFVLVPFLVQMRIAPSSFSFSSAGDFNVFDSANNYILTNMAIDQLSAYNAGINAFTTGMTQYRPGVVQAWNNQTAWMAFSSEL